MLARVSMQRTGEQDRHVKLVHWKSAQGVRLGQPFAFLVCLKVLPEAFLSSSKEDEGIGVFVAEELRK